MSYLEMRRYNNAHIRQKLQVAHGEENNKLLYKIVWPCLLRTSNCTVLKCDNIMTKSFKKGTKYI